VEQIKDTIQALLQSWKERGSIIVAEDVEAALGRALTAQEAVHLRPSAVKDGVLTLCVDSSTWLYYFTLHRQRLTAQVRAELAAVSQLKFVIGTVRKRAAKKKSCNAHKK
jgi:predicted nucleic acid-binding Zn ribbon protein